MKAGNKVVFISFLLGLFIWILDAVFDYLIFYEGTFWELLISNVPKHEIYIRSSFLVCCILFGFIAKKYTKKQILTEQALRESEERFRGLAEAAFEGIGIHEKGKILEANKIIAGMLGFELPELIGKDGMAFVAPESLDLVTEKITTGYDKPYQALLQRKDGSKFPAEILGKAIPYRERMVRVVAIRDITEIKQAENERERLILELREALDKVKTLSGLLPICASCKKIRDDKGYWHQVEVYIRDHSEVKFSHGICPVCADNLYGNL